MSPEFSLVERHSKFKTVQKKIQNSICERKRLKLEVVKLPEGMAK